MHGTKSLREAAFEFNIPGVVADDKDYQPCEYDDEGEDVQVSSFIQCSLIVYTHVVTCDSRAFWQGTVCSSWEPVVNKTWLIWSELYLVNWLMIT